MTDFDKSLKDYAQKERVCAPEGFETRIDQLTGKLNKNGANLSPVTHMRKMSYAAAIAACVLLIGGAAYAASSTSWFEIDWNGKTVAEHELQEPQTYTMQEGSVTESADEYAFRHEVKSGEIRRIYKIDENGDYRGSVSTGLVSVWESPDEFRTQLDGATFSGLLLPSHIPDGYTFDTAWTMYYLSPDYIDMDMPPAEVSVSESGNLLQTFVMPETYKSRIERYQVNYRNEAGNLIGFVGSYVQYSEPHTFGVDGDTKVSHPKVKGFKKSIFYSDTFTDDGISRTDSLFAIRKKAAGPQYFTDLDFGNPGASGANPKVRTYDGIEYRIYASGDAGIGETELMKMINSLGD